MKAAVALLAAIALTGCAHTRYAVTYCVTPAQYQQLKAAEPKRVGLSLTGQAQDDFKAAAGSAIALRAYADDLLGVIGGCTGG